MIKEFALINSRLAVACLLISCIFFLIKYKNFPVSIKVLGIFLFINLIIEIGANWLSHQQKSNIFLLHIYTVFEFLTWSFFYRILFKHKKWIATFFPWFMIAGGLAIIANSIFLEPLTGFNSNAKTFVQIVLISSAIYYFFDTFGKLDFTKSNPFALALINFAVLFYYSGSLFIFMFSRLLADHDVLDSRQYLFWAINAVLNLIFQILILISLWVIVFRKAKS